MFIKRTLLVLSLFSSPMLLAESLTNLNVREVSQQSEQGALVIDIRTAQEWQQTGLIPNSQPLSFFDKNGKSNPKQWLADLEKLKSNPKQKVILVCRSGNRSGKVGRYLTQQLDMPNISHLSNGIGGWLRAKRPMQSLCSTTASC